MKAVALAGLCACSSPNGTVVSSSQAFDIARDDTYLYWTSMDKTGGVVRRKPLAGGSEEVIASQLGRPMGLAVDAGWIFWGDGYLEEGTGIMAMPTTGGTPILIAQDRSAQRVLASGDDVYWIDDLGVSHVPKIGGTTVGVAGSGSTSIQGIATNGPWLYWGDESSNEIMRAPRAGGAYEVVVPPLVLGDEAGQGPSGIVFDGDDMYWSATDVLVHRSANGAIDVVANGSWAGASVTLDATWICFADNAYGAVFAWPRAGGPVLELADNGSGEPAVVLVGDQLYYAARYDLEVVTLPSG